MSAAQWVSIGLVCWMTQAAPPGGDEERRPAADVIRDTLERQRPVAQAIQGRVPPGLPTAGTASGDSGLWPEGFHLARRRGALRRVEGGWALEFLEGEDQGTAIRLLANSRLRQMEAYTSEGTREVEFFVSGMITEYGGENYLLVRNAVVLSRKPQQTRAAPKRPLPGDDSESGEMLKMLRRDANFGRPLQTELPEHSPDAVRPQPSVAPTEEFAKLLPEDSTLANRTGRLVQDADGPMFAFESDGDRPGDPPLGVLPSLAREQMESYAQNGLRSVVFVVSGEITAYRGRNHLLVRRFFIQPDDGNLK